MSGSALLRTVGGDARTCAGLPVSLIPEGDYSRVRMRTLYGSTENGFIPLGRQIPIFVDEPGYRTLGRRVLCDAQGEFSFDDLPDGSYFVTTTITWGVPLQQYVTSLQGGHMMQRVTVQGGERKRVVLTSQ